MNRTREQKGWGNRTPIMIHIDMSDGLNVPMCGHAHTGDTCTLDIFAVTCKVCRKELGLDCRSCGQVLTEDHENSQCMPCFLTARRRHYHPDDDAADLNPEL